MLHCRRLISTECRRLCCAPKDEQNGADTFMVSKVSRSDVWVHSERTVCEHARLAGGNQAFASASGFAGSVRARCRTIAQGCGRGETFFPGAKTRSTERERPRRRRPTRDKL